MKEKLKNYKDRTARYRQSSEARRSRYNRLAFVRLIAFVAAILAAIFLWSVHWLAAVGFILVFIAAFYRFILWHQRIQEGSRHDKRLARINRHEAESLEQLFVPGGPWSDGESFRDPEHPYSFDLDLFGPYSFFLYTNRCSTAIGRHRLADYLKHPAEPQDIEERQGAIRELSEKLDWRQHLQAYGLETEDDIEHVELLQQWLLDEPFMLTHRWLRVALVLTPIWVTMGLVIWFLYLPWYLGILFLLPPAWIMSHTRERVDKTHLRTTHAAKVLDHYARLIRHIETGEFQSDKLAHMQAQFRLQDEQASRRIQRLSYIINQLNVRYNAFAIFLNLYALWDLQWVYRLEKWKVRHRDLLPVWFDALSEFEALSSVGTLLYNNPEWTFPELTGNENLEGEALGHPLIHPRERVPNDLHMPTRGHIKLITGSNMAGKSTFLRTVGLNIVLAMAGAPVCARRLQLPRLRVYSSMRTQDALHESTSSFYAELKRLKFIIEAVERRENVFFLLDEILKGTNSRDRHTGSKALIRQLIRSGGGGLIATHDLELGQLAEQYGGAIENLCIEVDIRDGKLFFDYKIKPGVSQSFNATQLMRDMGINV